jgi:sugar lactone lactonase YvrE
MKKLVAEGHFFEGVRWHQGAWWVSDLYARQVLRITADGPAVVAEFSTEPSGLGWLPGGDLVVACMSDRRVLRVSAEGSLSEHARLAPYTRGWINDMVVDGKGRAYVGDFGFDLWGGASPEPGGIVCVDVDGRARNVAEGLLFPNGMIVTPDGRTLIVAETFGNRMTAFTINADGSLSERRPWADFGPVPSWACISDLLREDFAPDGCALDAEECVWVADALHNRVCRVAPGGKILRELRAPGDAGIYSCALGGIDGKTLLICVAPDYDPHARRARREAALYLETVDVPAAARG